MIPMRGTDERQDAKDAKEERQERRVHGSGFRLKPARWDPGLEIRTQDLTSVPFPALFPGVLGVLAFISFPEALESGDGTLGGA